MVRQSEVQLQSAFGLQLRSCFQNTLCGVKIFISKVKELDLLSWLFFFYHCETKWRV